MRTGERAERRQFLVEAVVALVQACLPVTQVGVVQVAAQPSAYRQRTTLALELDDVEECVELPFLNEEPLDPRVGGKFVDDALVRLLQELPRPEHERVAVLVVRVGENLQMQHQVGLQAREVVLPLVLDERPRTVLGKEAAHGLHGRDAVAEVAQFSVPLGNGGAAAPSRRRQK